MKRKVPPLLWLQICVLIFLVFPFVSAAFRDNDQAAILSGAWQIAHHQTPFLGAKYYNFDKQWGVFLLLSWLYQLFPDADPVFAANFLLTCIAGIAWLSLGLRACRARNASLSLVLPFLLSPVLLLYMPFLGTGWFSLAFLLLAFYFFGSSASPWFRTPAVLLVALAAACRGDVVLAVPALCLSQIPRRRVMALLRTPILWLVSAAAIVPVLLGKCFAGVRAPDTNPFSFDLRVFVGFLLFGFTPALLALLFLHGAAFAAISRRKPRFRLFYVLFGLAPFPPLLFYSGQMYTLRYLFLTIASLLFCVWSRRSTLVFGTWKQTSGMVVRRLEILLVIVTILPWLIGLQLPELPRPALTISNPTRFPTGDGQFPMGAYLAFAWQTRFRDHMAIDHNQKIWLAARSTNYQSCQDGTVPLLITPMSNFLEFAIRLQHKNPLPIDYLAQSSCGAAYVDARSILRGIRPDVRDGDFFSYAMSFVSGIDNGEPIMLVSGIAKQTRETRLMEEIRRVFRKHEAEIFRSLPARLGTKRGLTYLIYSENSCLGSTGNGLIRRMWKAERGERVEIDPRCFAPFAGWARTMLPPYMGL